MDSRTPLSVCVCVCVFPREADYRKEPPGSSSLQSLFPVASKITLDWLVIDIHKTG